MKLAKLLDFLVAHGRALSLIMLVVMAGLVVADFANEPPYRRFAWDGVGGFAAFYGFFSCIVLIAVAKLLGYAFLYQSEDFYDDQESEDD